MKTDFKNHYAIFEIILEYTYFIHPKLDMDIISNPIQIVGDIYYRQSRQIKRELVLCRKIDDIYSSQNSDIIEYLEDSIYTVDEILSHIKHVREYLKLLCETSI